MDDPPGRHSAWVDSQILLERARAHRDHKRHQPGEGQDDPCRMQAERQSQIRHPSGSHEWDDRPFRIVVHKRTLPPAAPAPKVPTHEAVHQGDQTEQEKHRHGQTEDSQAHREYLGDLHGRYRKPGYRAERPVQGRAQAGLLCPRSWRDPPDEGRHACDFKQVAVRPIGHVRGKAGGIRGQDAAAEIGIQVADLAGEHQAAVVEALVRPPEHHPCPLDEDREQQGKQQPLDRLGNGGQDFGDQVWTRGRLPRAGVRFSHGYRSKVHRGPVPRTPACGTTGRS